MLSALSSVSCKRDGFAGASPCQDRWCNCGFKVVAAMLGHFFALNHSADFSELSSTLAFASKVSGTVSTSVAGSRNGLMAL